MEPNLYSVITHLNWAAEEEQKAAQHDYDGIEGIHLCEAAHDEYKQARIYLRKVLAKNPQATIPGIEWLIEEGLKRTEVK